MNIQLVRNKIREFLTVRVSIYKWDLDMPDVLYYKVGDNSYPANTMIEAPVQNVVHTKQNKNSIITEARFPYRLTYIFPGELDFDSLPWRTLEGMLSFIHILPLIGAPDVLIEDMNPAELEDSISVARARENNGDWLVYLNFAYDVKFRTTELPDLGELQPPDYWDIDNPPSLEQLNVRINRAKIGFSSSDNTTYTEDNSLTIIPQ